MKSIVDEFKGSIFRHIVQNALMGVPVVRILAKRWYNTGMGRSRNKILPVFEAILKMLNTAGVDLENKVIVELGPGQTPDMLFSSLLFGAKKAIGLDVNKYLETKTSLLADYEETIGWISEAIVNGQLPKTQAFDERRFSGKCFIPDDYFEIKLYDGMRFPLEDETVDVIWSKSVLEHVKDYESMISEMRRVLRIGGMMCHIIDLRDHTTFEKGEDWLRFLRYGDRLWSLMTSNRSTWSNRLRSSQWESAFRAAEFILLHKEIEVLPFNDDFHKERLVLPFRVFEDEDLSIAWLKIVYRKKE